MTNPANICIRNILNIIYFLHSQNKTIVYICHIQCCFFSNWSGFSWQLWWQMSHKYTSSLVFLDFSFMWVDLRFDFLFWGNLTSVTVLASHSLRCPLFFAIKNQITISFWKKSYHFHHLCCTMNMVQVGSAKTKLNFLRYYSNISHQKIFFLNNSRWMYKLKTKNVYNWQ